MKLKKFKKNTAVKINSKEDYLLLMELAGKSGWKWCDGDSAESKNDRSFYYESEAIVFHVLDGCMTHAGSVNEISRDKKIITMRQAVKFEVGDKVRVRKDLDKCNENEQPTISDEMLGMAGQVRTIDCVSRSTIYTRPPHYLFDGFRWLKKWLEPVASCDSKEDTEQGTDTEPEKEPTNSEYFTGEVVCVNACGTALTEGKIYRFVNGSSTDDDGDPLPWDGTQAESVEDLNSRLCSDFIEVSGRGEKPEGFTGKVVCTKSKNQFTTKGKIYEFVNGLSVDDDGDVMPNCTGPVESVEDLNDRLFSNFIEVVE